MPSASHISWIDSLHGHKVIIDQIGQSGNHSDVRVRGQLINNSDYRSWNLYNNIHREITGTQNYHPGDFGFDSGPHSVVTYIDHTFTVEHNSDGTKSVNFTTHYGNTTVAFDGPSSSGANLTLTRIGSHPDPPGQPQFSNITPTSVTVSWSASPDDNGYSIDDYRLRRWNGSSQSGTYVDSIANNRTRNITGLTAGQTYTFAVYAHNRAGWSNASTDNHLGMLAGAWIRVGNSWKMAVPYVRVNGVWKQAVPYVRVNGVWKSTI